MTAMCPTPKIFRSLLLTSALSFMAAVFLIGITWITVAGVGCIPGLEVFGKLCGGQVSQFLAAFGSGSPFQGILTIALTGAFVGGLFDLYTLYRYQNLRHY